MKRKAQRPAGPDNQRPYGWVSQLEIISCCVAVMAWVIAPQYAEAIRAGKGQGGHTDALLPGLLGTVHGLLAALIASATFFLPALLQEKAKLTARRAIVVLGIGLFGALLLCIGVVELLPTVSPAGWQRTLLVNLVGLRGFLLLWMGVYLLCVTLDGLDEWRLRSLRVGRRSPWFVMVCGLATVLIAAGCLVVDLVLWQPGAFDPRVPWLAAFKTVLLLMSVRCVRPGWTNGKYGVFM